ncbi:hypothetical protein LB553_00835 [Mesorhizobium sp. CA8]|uniref:hypothetical protein n=1 Tax=Mesorhizobium sp. CA8 TaxID=2876637 RepID=UPI001CCA04FB|nr:hypothetical protein [Mesorhizobium sp. CA8]MBZ9759432.1 hypothetical protein [Mesorhizobium sp. CA8]
MSPEDFQQNNEHGGYPIVTALPGNVFQRAARGILCWFSLCQTFTTQSDDTGCWGECTLCGKRVGFVDRATLRAFADAEYLREMARRAALERTDGERP